MTDEIIGPGRPTKLTPELIVEAQKYVDECQDKIEHFESDNGKHWETMRVKLPTIGGLCRRLKISRTSLFDWTRPIADDEDITQEVRQLRQDFSNIVMDLEQEQEDRLINNGLEGHYNPMISKLLLSSKHGYVEKSRTDITSGDKPLTRALVKFIGDDEDEATA